MGSKHSTSDNQALNKDVNKKDNEELVGYTKEETNSNKFNSNGVVNKSPGDPGYSWHHHTPQGRKVLSQLTDQFYMD